MSTIHVSATTDALARVYTADILRAFDAYVSAAARGGTDERDLAHVRELCEVLTACGPAPSDRGQARRLSRLRAIRAALDVYVSAAEACGLLDANMVERLRSTKEENFRSARAECLACWFLAGKLGYSVSPIEGGGREGKQLEFCARTPAGDIVVEVKAPRGDLPKSKAWSGDDAHVLEREMKSAARQFGRNSRNLLILVPRLRTPVYSDREQLEKLIGDQVTTIFIPIDKSQKGFSEPGFVPRGRLVRPGKEGPDGTKLPAHTRVSAVLTIETDIEEDERGKYEDHYVHVVHNPYADSPIAAETFARFPQLVVINDSEMAWTAPEAAR